MKKMLMVSIMILSLVMASNAQVGNKDKKSGDRNAKMEERQKKELAKMKKELSLTDEQVIKVEALQKEQAETMKANMENAKKGEKKDRETMHKEMAAMRTEYVTKIKSILTEEQYAKYEELKKANRQKRDVGGDRPEPLQGEMPEPPIEESDK